MDFKKCAACNQSFLRCPQVHTQQYCSNSYCQRERKRRSQLAKRKKDPDYKDNQTRAQKAWSKRNSQYWKEYRKTNPEYLERNRTLQRERNKKRKQTLIAKMSPKAAQVAIPTGLYYLTPLFASGVAKMDEIIVEIKMISTA